MKTIPITAYIAFNKPKQAQELLEKYGMKRAKNVRDLIHRLDVLMMKKKEDALKEFAMLHPDRELILHYSENKSGACGCSGADGGCKCSKCSGVDGADKDKGAGGTSPNAGAGTQGFYQTIKPYVPLIVGGTILLIGVVVVLKNA